MKNVKTTIEIPFDFDELKDEVVSAMEDFVMDAMTDANPPETILSRLYSSFFSNLQNEAQMAVDSFLERDAELDVDQYLDRPNDCVTVSGEYSSVDGIVIEVEADIEDREPELEETDFNRLIEVLNDIGLNLADKTAILKIAKDAGVE